MSKAELAKEFKTLRDDDYFFAISRQRLVLDGHPTKRGAVYIQVQSMNGMAPPEEIAEATGFPLDAVKFMGLLDVQLGIVSPSYVPRPVITNLWKSLHLDRSNYPTPIAWWEWTCELCVEYGACAPLENQAFADNQSDAHFEWALSESLPMLSMAGFYLDRQINKAGANGWDWLACDTLGIRRKKEEKVV